MFQQHITSRKLKELLEYAYHLNQNTVQLSYVPKAM